jgi:hypothetical protein
VEQRRQPAYGEADQGAHNGVSNMHGLAPVAYPAPEIRRRAR